MKKSCIKAKFSLVELIVVLVIISLLSGLAISSLREESPASALNKYALAFEAWCAQVRYQCAENGEDMIVYLGVEDKVFFASNVPGEEEVPTVPESGPLRFNIPENVDISTVESSENVAGESEYLEVFRFFPSGGGACINRPVIRIDNLAKHFDISFFNGKLIIADGDKSEEDEK